MGENLCLITPSNSQDVEQWELPDIAGGQVYRKNHSGKQLCDTSEVKINILYNPANLLLRIYPRKTHTYNPGDIPKNGHSCL